MSPKRFAAFTMGGPARGSVQLLVVLAVTGALSGQSVPDAGGEVEERVRVERLAGLAAVWGQAKIFHPTLADAGIDWDAALVSAIREVRSARTALEFGSAVQRMLDRLEDPLTRVETRGAGGPLASRGPSMFGVRALADGVLVATAGDYYALAGPATRDGLRELAEKIPGARAVVFDLRSDAPTDPFGRMQLAASFSAAERLLTTEPLPVPGERRRVYYGLESPSPFSSGQYRTGFFVEAAPSVEPTPRSVDLPVAFILNRNSGALPSMAPLQAAGRGVVVYEGDPRRHTIGDAIEVALPDGLRARIRRSVPVLPDGRSAAFLPDSVVGERDTGDGDTSDVDPALEAALALVRSPDVAARRSRPRSRVPATERPPRERAYPEMDPGEPEMRLLAAFRLWNAIEHFYPYKDLLDRPWASVLMEMIPIFEEARDAREYTRAVAEMAARIQDSHAYVSGAFADEHLIAPGYPPIRVRRVEDVLLVTAIYDAAAAESAGVEVGHRVVTVDGVDADARLAEVSRLLSTSTPQSLLDRATLAFLNGPVGSDIRLTLEDADGSSREVRLERRHEDFSTLYHRERTGEIVQVLPGNIGYVDLDRLSFDMVDPMFETLKDTRGIIFDMRGYPQGTIWMIAPRLADEARPVAEFWTPLPGHRSPAPAAERFLQVLEPAPVEARYGGPTVMLIDERTVSQAEHTGLYLEAANGTRFVGSPTAGANGEITSITLPGAITVGFTGQAVRFPDGRPLQRVGLVPHVEARPTVAGIRAGRDEVLEAALRLLAEG